MIVNGLIKKSRKPPDKLCKSLTWGRGNELADHERFTVEIDAVTGRDAPAVLAGGRGDLNRKRAQAIVDGSNTGGLTRNRSPGGDRQIPGVLGIKSINSVASGSGDVRHINNQTAEACRRPIHVIIDPNAVGPARHRPHEVDADVALAKGFQINAVNSAAYIAGRRDRYAAAARSYQKRAQGPTQGTGSSRCDAGLLPPLPFNAYPD